MCKCTHLNACVCVFVHCTSVMPLGMTVLHACMCVFTSKAKNARKVVTISLHGYANTLSHSHTHVLQCLVYIAMVKQYSTNVAYANNLSQVWYSHCMTVATCCMPMLIFMLCGHNCFIAFGQTHGQVVRGERLFSNLPQVVDKRFVSMFPQQWVVLPKQSPPSL